MSKVQLCGIATCVLAALAFASACGSEDNASHSGSSVGGNASVGGSGSVGGGHSVGGNTSQQTVVVGGSKQLKDLSSAELYQVLCTDTGAYITAQMDDDTIMSMSCTMIAAIAAEMAPDQCPATFSECMKQSPSSQSDQCTADTSSVADCTATVSQYNTCVHESVAAMKTIASVGAKACTDPTALDAVSDKPASCATIEQLCPGVAEGVPTAGGTLF